MANRADVLQIIQARVSGFLYEAQRLTGDTEKPSTPHALAWAMRKLGYSLDSLIDVSNAELADVTGSKVDALLDLAELRLLEDILLNLTMVTNQAGPVRDDWNDLSKRLREILPVKRSQVASAHGIDLDGVTRRLARVQAI